MTELAQKPCTPCRGGVAPLSGPTLVAFQEWLPFRKVIHDHHMAKPFLFPDFRTALSFVDHIAGEEGHHPDLFLSGGKVDVRIHTHKIEGLNENDFILAATIDEIFFSGLPAASPPGGATWLA